MSCTTLDEKIEMSRPPDIKFEKTPDYVLDTETLDNAVYEKVTEFKDNIKYGQIKPDGKIEVTDDENLADVVVLDSENYSRVGDIMTLTNAYRDVLKEHAVLINLYVMEINKYKELVELERLRSQILTDSWANSERLYLQERRLRQRENIINKSLLFGTNALWLVGVAALAL